MVPFEKCTPHPEKLLMFDLGTRSEDLRSEKRLGSIVHNGTKSIDSYELYWYKPEIARED